MPSKNFEDSNTLHDQANTWTLNAKLFYHSDLKSSLENVLLKESDRKSKGTLEKLFSTKTQTLKAIVKALLNEINLREKLDLHLLNRIDEDICQQKSHIPNLLELKVHYSLDLFLEVKEMILGIEDKVLDLEKEKRTEYLECWRDLMFLKKYLMSALREYWDFVKRRELLSGDLN